MDCTSRRTIQARRACLTWRQNGSIVQTVPLNSTPTSVPQSESLEHRGSMPAARSILRSSSRPPRPAHDSSELNQSSSQSSTAACSFHHRASRYVCNASAVHHGPTFYNVASSTAVLGNRSVFFVGDSLSTQHFHAFACEMEMDQEVPVGGMHGLLAAGLDASCATRRNEVTSGRICAVKAGGLLHEPSTAAVCRTLALSGSVRAGDIVVANEGLWRRAYDENGAARELERVSEFAQDGSCVATLRNLGARLLWRETSAQHFTRTLTGQFRPGCKELRCGECGPVANASTLQALNAAVSTRMHGLGVPVLPFFEATLPLWAAHVARLSEFVRRKHILDCTHWCEPNAVFAALTPALLQHTHTPPLGAGSRPRLMV